jgi:thymidylate kinase
MSDKFICFIGMDGSGKTTLAQKTTERLLQQGKNFQYRYGQMKPFLTRPVLNLGRWWLGTKKITEKNYSEFTKTKQTGFTKLPLAYSLYSVLVLIDAIPQLFFRISLPRLMGQGVVSDRYIYDTLINLSLNNGDSIDEICLQLKRYFNFLPVPDRLFIIDVPEDVAYARKNDISDIAYLTFRRNIYLELGQRQGGIVLDGNKPVEQLVTEVIETIDK